MHHAVDDAPEMYRRIRALADQLTADPGEFDRETSEEAGELLRWLADGNYMILGHAAYSANELASPRAHARTADAEGVLRGPRADLAAGAAARVPQRRAAGDLQVAAGVHGPPLGPLRLRHGRDAGQPAPARR